MIRKIAERYDIDIAKRPPPDHLPKGPMGGAIDVFNHRVYVESRMAPFQILHEICHVVCAVPFTDIDEIPEEWILMPFERALARSCLPAYEFNRVLRWQLDTVVEAFDQLFLDDVPLSVYGGLWQNGLRRAKLVGLLDADRAPTFRWPDWSKISLRAIRSVVEAP